jgi:flagellar motility protein MotE (MotC chaperone)
LKIFLLFITFCLAIFAAEKGATLSTQECNKIFEQRKYELQLQLERIEEKTQALDALNSAQKHQQVQREEVLQNKINQLNSNLNEIKQKEQNIKNMLDENKKVLEETKVAKESKVKDATVKMKPGAAAAMLSEMNATQAASILYTMEPKKMAEFIGKMDPKKAAGILNRINQGPPFD